MNVQWFFGLLILLFISLVGVAAVWNFTQTRNVTQSLQNTKQTIQQTNKTEQQLLQEILDELDEINRDTTKIQEDVHRLEQKDPSSSKWNTIP